ncbi:MAG: GLUG motif-containing protein [Spirochaetales bacterium]|nr:GLUG motif-containing protein [Spirochaetales bacterium]
MSMRKLPAGILSLALFFSISSCDMASESTSDSSESGTESSPYTISSAEELDAVRGGVEGYEDWGLDDYYTLTNDIDLSSYDWEPIGSASFPFSGGFDGAGYSISNLTVDISTSSAGLFASISGTVEDLFIEGANVSGRQNVGILSGWSYGEISDCAVSGTVISTYGGNVGGLVGSNYGTLSDSYAEADITSQADSGEGYGSGSGENVGGLVGYNSGALNECYATGKVTAYDDYAGGFVGYHDEGSLFDSYATGEVSSSEDHVGGFAGYNDEGSLSSCYSLGAVGSTNSSAVYVHGFAGDSASSDGFESCYYNEALAGFDDDYAEDVDLDVMSSFEGFDFDSTWSISSSVNGGTPYLLNLVP